MKLTLMTVGGLHAAMGAPAGISWGTTSVCVLRGTQAPTAKRTLMNASPSLVNMVELVTLLQMLRDTNVDVRGELLVRVTSLK